jgi:hypothetical protein
MRIAVVLSVFVLLVCVSLGGADFVRYKQEAEEGKEAGLAGQMTDAYYYACKKNERAIAIASGTGRTCLGVYIFDAAGNCVAHDDRSTPSTADDLIAEWLPATSTRYSIEVRNGGFDVNNYEIALR